MFIGGAERSPNQEKSLVISAFQLPCFGCIPHLPHLLVILLCSLSGLAAA